MSRNIWIGIVVVVVLAAGAWWYFNQSNTLPSSTQTLNPQTSGTQPQQQNSTSQATTNTTVSPAQSNNSEGFAAPRSSGPAPLIVDFLVNNDGVPATVDFGDGVSGPINQFEDTAPARYQISFVHTYANPGNYTATVKDSSGHIVGSTKITVQ